MLEKESGPEQKKDRPTIVSGRCRRTPLAGGEIAAWLDHFDLDLNGQGLSRRDVCTLVAEVVKGEIEQRWVGEAKFADMLLWLACRSDAGIISRLCSSAPSWDFHVDVYPWVEVDVWMSRPSPQVPESCTSPPPASSDTEESAEARVR